MKNKAYKISLISLLLFLCGCNNHTESINPTDKNTFTTDKSSDSIDSSSTDIHTEYSIVSGSFTKEKESYISTSSNSILLFNDGFQNGTYGVSIHIQDDFAENGIVFLYDTLNQSYYFVGLNLVGQLILQRYKGNTMEQMKTISLDASKTEFSLAVALDDTENTVDVYMDEEFMFQSEIEYSDGNLYGFKAGSKDTSYQDVSVIPDKNTFNEDLSNYHIAHGTFEAEEEIQSVSRSALAIHDQRTFEYGVYQADVSIANPVSQNGIVFSLSEDKRYYWEGSGISYYFFYITETGRAALGKTDNGTWATVFDKVIRDFEKVHTYQMKIVKDENTISCYVDGILYGTYSDNSPLKGTKIGIRAGDIGVSFKNIRIHEQKDMTKDISDIVDVQKGSFYGIGNQIVAKEDDSFMTMKDSQFKNGTIKTYFSPHGSGDNGIVFRVKDKENYYWFGYKSSGMVSFRKVVAGKVVYESKAKFLPYGSYSYMGYEVKIVINDNQFYCYFDGRLSVVYNDTETLDGLGYGLYAKSKYAQVSRFEKYDNKEEENYDTLIFGHSYMDYWYTYKEDLPEYRDIYDIGIGASISSHWNDYQNEIIAYQPHLGIYAIGINDISANISASVISSNVQTLLLNIKKSLPDFEVVLFGVSRCPARENYRTQISETNQLYKSLSETYSWIHYVDVELLFCDSNGKPLSKYFTDELHPTHEGYKMMIEKMREVI